MLIILSFAISQECYYILCEKFYNRTSLVAN